LTFTSGNSFDGVVGSLPAWSMGPLSGAFFSSRVLVPYGFATQKKKHERKALLSELAISTVEIAVARGEGRGALPRHPASQQHDEVPSFVLLLPSGAERRCPSPLPRTTHGPRLAGYSLFPIPLSLSPPSSPSC